MMVMPGKRLAEEIKHELWQRWQRGENLSRIGEAIGKPVSTVRQVILRRGGFAPAARVRCRQGLHAWEREEISRSLSAGLSIRQMARVLRRSASTVSREIKRNGGRRGYRACRAETQAW